MQLQSLHDPAILVQRSAKWTTCMDRCWKRVILIIDFLHKLSTINANIIFKIPNTYSPALPSTIYYVQLTAERAALESRDFVEWWGWVFLQNFYIRKQFLSLIHSQVI